MIVVDTSATPFANFVMVGEYTNAGSVKCFGEQALSSLSKVGLLDAFKKQYPLSSQQGEVVL